VLAALATLVVGSTGPVPAAPVPKHLMPKQDPYCYPTRVGDRHESVIGDHPIVCVVTKVEKSPDGILVEVVEERDGKQKHAETVLVSAQGVKVIEYSGNKLAPPFWWVKLPHTEGNTWPDELNRQVWTAKTIGWQEIEVRAGKFRAIHVQHIDLRCTTSYWFAPGVGCIKWTDGKNGREMIRFTPGK
jgi:hypothetical protein